jgi:DNA-binding NarL/FixJ family response regulator
MRLLIADDHDLVRDTVAAFLDRKSDMETVVV